MAAIRLAKSSVVLLLLAFGLVAVEVAVILSMTGRSTKVQLSDDAILEIRIESLITSQVHKASQLAQEGQHMQAARMFINAAGAQRALLKSDSDRGSNEVTMVLEKLALQQLALVGKDQAYRECLRSLYPEWREEDRPSSGSSPFRE